MAHIPVLLNEALEKLDPKPGELIIDGTTNGGGHLEAIIEKMSGKGRLAAIDWDKDIIDKTKARIEKMGVSSALRMIWVNDNYANISEILDKNNLGKADGLLLDLGFSSEHLESEKGFSFRTDKDEPLDMRYERYGDRSTAAEVVNSLREEELSEIIYKYGEERFSRHIAHAIVESRKDKKIIGVSDLVAIVKSAVPKFFKKGEMSVVSRTFQALRIYVNDEFENIEKIMAAIPMFMNKGGRVAIISFHSLEDRIIKNGFKELEAKGIAKILTKKPIVPTDKEIQENPRSRSSKLRAIKII